MKHGLLNSILLGMLLTGSAAAFAAKGTSLLDMADQLDGLEKQDFQAAIDKANACTRGRNFSCSESELAKAAKSVNGGQDKKILAAAHRNIANEKARIAEEERQRAEEERRVAEVEERQRRVEEAREERRQARERQAREEEERQSAQAANNSVYTIPQRGGIDDINAVLAPIQNQTDKFLAEQAERDRRASAERERVRAERDERVAEQRRDAERDRAARADAQRSARATRAENTRSSYGSSSTSGGGSAYASNNASVAAASGSNYTNGSSNGNAKSMDSPAKPEKKYTWIDELMADGHNKPEAAACKDANGKIDKQNLNFNGTESKVISRGGCTCKPIYYPMPPHELASYECTVSYRVERVSIYNPNATGSSKGIAK